VVAVVAVIGHHDSGKTRLLERVIPRLVERGYRIGVAKHAPGWTFADEQTDTGRLRRTGAQRILLRGDDRSVLDWGDGPDAAAESEIEWAFAGCDLVLLEGWKGGPHPKIEVFRSAASGERPLAREIAVIAVVTDDRIAVPDGVPIYSPREIDAIVDLLERRIERRDETAIARATGG